MDDIKFKFTACNPPRCSCPEVEYDSGKLSIVDDYGGKVNITLSELEIVVDRTKILLEKALEDKKKQEAAQLEEYTRRTNEILEKGASQK